MVTSLFSFIDKRMLFLKESCIGGWAFAGGGVGGGCGGGGGVGGGVVA